MKIRKCASVESLGNSVFGWRKIEDTPRIWRQKRNYKGELFSFKEGEVVSTDDKPEFVADERGYIDLVGGFFAFECAMDGFFMPHSDHDHNSFARVELWGDIQHEKLKKVDHLAEVRGTHIKCHKIISIDELAQRYTKWLCAFILEQVETNKNVCGFRNGHRVYLEYILTQPEPWHGYRLWEDEKLICPLRGWDFVCDHIESIVKHWNIPSARCSYPSGYSNFDFDLMIHGLAECLLPRWNNTEEDFWNAYLPLYRKMDEIALEMCGLDVHYNIENNCRFKIEPPKEHHSNVFG